MLILSRRPGETIRIGDDIAITTLGIQGLQVRLGIEAPAGVAVHRQEIYDRIQAERAAADQHIDARIKAAAAEPVTLCVQFSLPNAQAASALVNILPHGQCVFGTQARVSRIELMPLEAEPCAS